MVTVALTPGTEIRHRVFIDVGEIPDHVAQAAAGQGREFADRPQMRGDAPAELDRAGMTGQQFAQLPRHLETVRRRERGDTLLRGGRRDLERRDRPAAAQRAGFHAAPRVSPALPEVLHCGPRDRPMLRPLPTSPSFPRTAALQHQS
jgi:hypothetical protein